MARNAWTVSLLLSVSTGLGAGLALDSAAASAPRRAAVVTGYVELCGGPAPGRCWKGAIGFCQPSKGCVTSDRVGAVTAPGRRVATQELHHGRFRLRLIPGRYTIELLGDGKRVRGKVMETKRVWARDGRTTTVRFLFNVP